MSGENTTITLSKTSFTPKVEAMISDLAEDQFNKGEGDHGTDKDPRVFTDLSKQEQLDIAADYMWKSGINRASAYKEEKDKAAVEVVPHKL